MTTKHFSRRQFLILVPPALAGLVLAACDGEDDEAPPSTDAPTETPDPTQVPEAQSTASGSTGAALQPTPACSDDDEPTIPQTEGPFFTPDSPERTSLLEDGISGTPLHLEGDVVNTACEPISGALIDFWQCDDEGEYDNVTYRLRGHQFTDANGTYRLETIGPGLYPGRTRHIHVKVQAPNQPVLTTQLYFPNESRNDSDGIYDPSLLVTLAGSDDAPQATFRFVLDV